MAIPKKFYGQCETLDKLAKEIGVAYQELLDSVQCIAYPTLFARLICLSLCSSVFVKIEPQNYDNSGFFKKAANQVPLIWHFVGLTTNAIVVGTSAATVPQFEMKEIIYVVQQSSVWHFGS